ncbi:MAG: alpha/beta hydrolase [Lachnospiraceae bacterium]|nr:alpha/beta hydrolase [Lachnospiraceae bacterium]
MTKREQKLIELIRRVHGLVDSPDIEKKRQSQEQWGAFLGNTKEITYQEFTIENMTAEWVKVNRPHSKAKVILYCHGGGFTTGSTKYARTVTSKLAVATSMEVLVFDYRLAPEYPYPAALEDAVKAWNYLMLQGYGAEDVIVAGDSAGGNMALELVLKLEEEKRMLPKGLVLFSPWTDLTCSGISLKEREAVDPVLTPEYLYRIREEYAKGQNYEEPYLSPLFGDLKGFPPTYIQVGENEILYSDSVRLYKKLCEEKVMARIDRFDKMWHVFQMSPVKTAQEAINKCAEFIFGICK